MVKNRLIIALLSSLLAQTVLAQQPPDRIQRTVPVTPLPTASQQPVADNSLILAHAEELALRNNPSLARAAARVDAAWGRLVQAGLYPNTVIGYHANEVGNLGGPGVQGGFIRQKIITAGKIQLDRTIAGHEFESAEVLLTAQEQRILNDVRIRFLDLLVAQQRIELTEELVRIATAFVRSTETLLQAGRVNENTLLQAQLELDGSQILLDNAGNNHREAWRRLWSVIGDPGLPVQRAKGNLAEPVQQFTWQESLQTLLQDHPELTAARIAIERAHAALHRACRERYPNVDVMLSVRHHNITSDDVANIQVGFPLPLFDRNQGNIFKAQAELSAADYRVQQIEYGLTDQLAVSFRRYANSRHQVDRYRQQMLPRAHKSLDYVTKGYREGQVDFLTLLTSQRTYYQVNLQYLDAVRQLRASEIMMDGQLLGNSLQLRAIHNR